MGTSHPWFRTPMKYSLKCLSALILPLLMGVFTVVITFQQQKAAREQWLQDRLESREQRLEDRNLTKEQRQQEWLIASGQRSDLREESSKRYKDELLVDYLKEMGELLKESNGSLMSNPITSILARVKTLNVFRQLEGKRAALVLRFLYESRQLTNTNTSKALDISTATLTELDGNALETLFPIGRLNAYGTLFQNCDFNHYRVDGIEFTSAELYNVSFSFSPWCFEVNYTLAFLDGVNFSYAALETVQFTSTWMKNVHFLSARLYRIEFTQAWLINVHFSFARLGYVDFLFARLENVSFSYARLVMVGFQTAKLSKFHFSISLFSKLRFRFYSRGS